MRHAGITSYHMRTLVENVADDDAGVQQQLLSMGLSAGMSPGPTLSCTQLSAFEKLRQAAAAGCSAKPHFRRHRTTPNSVGQHKEGRRWAIRHRRAHCPQSCHGPGPMSPAS